MTQHSFKNFLFLSLFTVLLGGCQLPTGGEAAPCPSVGILPQAEKVTFFDASGEHDMKHITSAARFGGYRGACVLKNGRLQFVLDVDFSGERGKAGGAMNEQPLSYFVAVLDANENILQRDSFASTVLFNDAGQGLAREKHQINLPLDASIKEPKEAVTAAVKNQRVVMGFILTPEQLSYNTEVPVTPEEQKPATPAPAPAKEVKKSNVKKP